MTSIRTLSSRVGPFALVIALAPFAVTGCTATATGAPSAPAGCGPDDTVGCRHAAGYSCPSGDDPERTNSSLVCSYGREDGAGSTLYCCLQFQSSSCTPDSTVVGCRGNSFGFSCTGSDSPDSTDSTLLCSDATPSGGELLYCCTD